MQKWVTVPGFFAAFCLYLWLWVNPALLSVDPALLPDDAGLVPIPGFSWSPLFLKGFLVYPGGPAECVWLLIAQSYYYPWAGALVITAVAALLGVATHSLMAALAGGSVPIVRFLPAILMVALYSRYADKLPMLVGLLLAMLAVYAYVRTGRRGPAFRLAAFLALSAAVYHVAGGAYLLYAALCGVFELRRRQGRLLGVCYLLLGGIVPYAVGVWLWDRSLTHAYAYLSPFSPGAYTEPRIILLCVYLAILLPALGCAVWPWLAAATKRRGVGAILQRLGHLKAGSGLELAVVLVAAAVVVVLSFDSGERSLRQIDWFAAERMWPQVLREAQGLPRDRYTFTAIHAVNRALYETGRLPYEMFAYPCELRGSRPFWI